MIENKISTLMQKYEKGKNTILMIFTFFQATTVHRFTGIEDGRHDWLMDIK